MNHGFRCESSISTGFRSLDEMLDGIPRPAQKGSWGRSLLLRELALLAEEWHVPLIVNYPAIRLPRWRFWQKTPQKTLAGFGAVPFDADVVLLLYRAGYYTFSPRYEDHAEIIVAKNRGGGTGTISCHWDPRRQFFWEEKPF